MAGEEQRPLWRLSLLDVVHDDGWSWDIDRATMMKIVEFMTQMERLSWHEIWQMQAGGKNRGQKHKYISVESLCPTAQRRLLELELDDWDRVFRFRTGWAERLWGVIADEEPRVFYPVWWDENHRVCPGKDPN